MANPDHLAQLNQGVKRWNQWRLANTQIQSDLRGVHLSGADLSGANLIRANLREANLSGANLSGVHLGEANLSGANLIRANLSGADLSGADLSGADLSGADLRRADLSGTDLREADLSGTDLIRANLSEADLIIANLSEANLSEANLSEANLSEANLSEVFLTAAQLLASDLTAATLTGACVQDWNINSATWLEDVICEYVYLKEEWSDQERKWLLSDRRPSDPNRIFAPGEFTKLFQKALETVDLIFVDGIDWQAFFQSFQELRSQYDNADLAIQAIEKKSDGAFVIRLEVPPEVDKGAIERQAKELYERDRQLLEARYQALLQAKDGQFAIYQEWLGSERQRNTELTTIIKTMADKETAEITQHFHSPVTSVAGHVAGNQNNVTNSDTFNNDMRGANIANFANQVRDNASQNASQFSQMVGQNADEIARLISTLREQAQQFPSEQRDEAQMGLEDLQRDLSTPDKLEPKRIKRRIIALLAIAAALGTTIATATDFANNVLELAGKFGIPPSELLHHLPNLSLPPANQP